MADWGLYSALRGTDDWATKRQDKRMNLLAAEKMELRQQKKVAESNKAEADIAKYMEELQNLKVLPEDQERVAQAEKQARQSIVKGIANANGDLRKYMSTGGITALNEYKTNVMQSEEVKQAGVNSVNLANYIKMEQKGNQRHKLIDVEVPMIGEDGNPVLDAQGNPQFQVEKMTMQDQYNKYKAGEITKLNYNGSETKVKLGLKDFANQYKNPSNIYQKDNFVTESNVYEKMLDQTASEEYAREQAKRYGSMVKAGGDPWRWKAGDESELALKMAKLQQSQAKANAKAAAGGERSLTSTAISNVVGEIQKLEAGQSMQVPVELINAAEKQTGWEKNKEGNYRPRNGTMVYDQLKPGDDKFSYDLSKASEITPMDVVALDGPKDDKGQSRTSRYIRYKVTYDDPSAWYNPGLGGDYSDLPFDDVLWRTSIKDKGIEKNWEDDGSGNYTGYVLMGIDDKINSPTVKMAMNKFTGINQNAQYAHGYATNETMQQLSPETIQYYMDANPGMSAEDVIEAFMIEKTNYE